jgi:hypothetical protein
MGQARRPAAELRPAIEGMAIAMRIKFQLGARARANEKAPGDYEGCAGTILGHKAATSEYQVQFDGDDRGPAWLNSCWLDPIA